ncbi:MAG: hypothetical protein ACI8TX_002917 [Hyphomicrobiaceae bacterium]|jgi:hypothetical protein
MFAVVELPAEDRVRDRPRPPVRKEQVGTDDPRKIILTLFPFWRVVVFAAIGEIPKIANRDAIAIDGN